MASQAKRQLLSLGVAAGLAAAIGAWAWLGVHDGEEREGARRLAEQSVFGMTIDEITSVVVTVEGKATRLVRVGGEISIVADVPMEPDRAAVEALFASIAGLLRQRSVEALDGDLAPLGLAPPRASVEVTRADGTIRVLSLGLPNAFDESVFARVEGDPALFSITLADARALARTPLQLRDRRVLPFVPAEVRAVQIALPGAAPFALIRVEGDDWRLSAPQPDRADPVVVARVVEQLSRLEAVQAVAELADPSLRLTGDVRGGVVVALVDGRLLQLELARQEIGLLARDPTKTTLWRLDEAGAKALSPSIEELTDKALLGTAGAEIRRIAFEPRGAAGFVAERGGAEAAQEDWQLVEPRRAPARSHKLAFALTTLVSLQVDRWIDAPPATLASLGLDAPERTIRLFGDGGQALEVIRVASPGADGGQWLHVEGSGKAGRVEAARLRELPAALEDVLAP